MSVRAESASRTPRHGRPRARRRPAPWRRTEACRRILHICAATARSTASATANRLDDAGSEAARMAATRSGVSVPCNWMKSGFTAATAPASASSLGSLSTSHQAQLAAQARRPATLAWSGLEVARRSGMKDEPGEIGARAHRRIGGFGRLLIPQILTRSAMGRALWTPRPGKSSKAGPRCLSHCSGKLCGDCAGGGGGVRRAGDRPADDQDVGAGGMGLGRASSPAAGRPGRRRPGGCPGSPAGSPCRRPCAALRSRGPSRPRHRGRTPWPAGARRTTCSAAGPRWPTDSSKVSSMLVSTVTPITLTRGIDRVRGGGRFAHHHLAARRVDVEDLRAQPRELARRARRPCWECRGTSHRQTPAVRVSTILRRRRVRTP